jgi:hypothetical protein
LASSSSPRILRRDYSNICCAVVSYPCERSSRSVAGPDIRWGGSSDIVLVPQWIPDRRVSYNRSISVTSVADVLLPGRCTSMSRGALWRTGSDGMISSRPDGAVDAIARSVSSVHGDMSQAPERLHELALRSARQRFRHHPPTPGADGPKLSCLSAWLHTQHQQDVTRLTGKPGTDRGQYFHVQRRAPMVVLRN